jgi:hypothetical protein
VETKPGFEPVLRRVATLVQSERKSDLDGFQDHSIFQSVLEPDRTRLRWVIARVPFDPAKAVEEALRVAKRRPENRG